MRTGIIGDIHQDLAALRATLDGPLATCDRLIALGDFLDRGADDGGAVIDELEQRGCELVIGNHELAYLGGPVFPGMVEARNLPQVARLRQLVRDGHLKAATHVGDVLCVHGGLSRTFWRTHLAAQGNVDVPSIADQLNRELQRAVRTGLFRTPGCSAGNLRRPGTAGPIWAHSRSEMLDVADLPPLRQVVGHVAYARGEWHEVGAGSLYPVLWQTPPEGQLGHVVLETPSGT